MVNQIEAAVAQLQALATGETFTEKDLYDAYNKFKFDRACEIISSGQVSLDLKFMHKNKCIPFVQKAAMEGHSHVLEALIKAGVDINAGGDESPLTQAAWANKHTNCKTLVLAGA